MEAISRLGELSQLGGWKMPAAWTWRPSAHNLYRRQSRPPGPTIDGPREVQEFHTQASFDTMHHMANRISIIERPKAIKVGREPVVVVPLKLWRKLEDYLEDQEALASQKFLKKIQKARKEAAKGKLIHPFR